MDSKKAQELMDMLKPTPENLRKLAEDTLSLYFEDGNTDDDALAHIKNSVEHGSLHMERLLLALDTLLADQSNDEYLIYLVGHLIDISLEHYDSKHAREWVREKTAMIRKVYDQAVKERGTYF